MAQSSSAHRYSCIISGSGVSDLRYGTFLRVLFSQSVSHFIYADSSFRHRSVLADFNRDNGRGLVAGVCVGILVAAVIAFVIVKYLILFRTWVTEKKLGMDGDSPAARESRLATTEIAMAEKDQV